MSILDFYKHISEPASLDGTPKKHPAYLGYLNRYERIIFVEGYQFYICNCEKYPLIWMWWWFVLRLNKTFYILDTGLDYILQTWGLISPTSELEFLKGIAQRIKDRIHKNQNEL